MNTPGVRKSENANGTYYANSRPEVVARVPSSVDRVLDVGCGNGMVGASIKNKYPDCKVIGLEFSKTAADIASHSLDEVWRLNLNDLNPGEIKGDFDLIICADIIEHLLDPENFLKILRTKIRSNGKAVLSIPNVRHWSVLLPLLINDRFTYTDQGLLDKTHVHLFTYTEIKLMLSRCGWEITNTNINRLQQKLNPNMLKELLKMISSLGGNEEYSKTTIEAFQYIIDIKPII
tara:strand:+ start:1694 stop:2392 length:699 start_codon:yes stop_codon:yes gene_type:complete